MVTTQVDSNGDGVVDETKVSAKILNADGTTSVTETLYHGNGTLVANRVGQTLTTASANGLVIIANSELDGDGVGDRRTQSATTVGTNGSKTVTTTQLTGDGSVQLPKSVVTVSDDQLRQTMSQYVSNHTIADVVTVTTTCLNTHGSLLVSTLGYALCQFAASGRGTSDETFKSIALSNARAGAGSLQSLPPGWLASGRF